MRSRELPLPPPPEEAVAAAALSRRLSREGRGLHSPQHGERPPRSPLGPARRLGAGQPRRRRRGSWGLVVAGWGVRERRRGRSRRPRSRGMMSWGRGLLGPPTKRGGEGVWGPGRAAGRAGAAGRGAGRQEAAPGQGRAPGPRWGAPGSRGGLRPAGLCQASSRRGGARWQFGRGFSVSYGTGAIEAFCGQLGLCPAWGGEQQ